MISEHWPRGGDPARDWSAWPPLCCCGLPLRPCVLMFGDEDAALTRRLVAAQDRRNRVLKGKSSKVRIAAMGAAACRAGLAPLLWSLLLGPAGAAPQIARIPSGETGEYKWRGAAAVGDDVIFCPQRSAHVLSLDAAAGTTRLIPHNEETGEDVYNWAGAVAVGGAVYCVPLGHAAVLSVDAATGRTAVVPVDHRETGDWKWSGGAAVGATLCLCPRNADDVVLYDTVSGDTALVDTGERGNQKWKGAAAHGARAYCTPYNSDNVLSVDPAGRATDLIATEVTGGGKWSGDGAVVGDGVYFAPALLGCVRFWQRCFAPYFNDHVLVLLLGGARPSVRLVGTGRTGGCKCPDVLVVETRTRDVSFVATGDTGQNKWAGAAVVGTTVFFAPNYAADVLSVTTAAPTVHPTAAPTTASCAAGASTMWVDAGSCSNVAGVAVTDADTSGVPRNTWNSTVSEPNPPTFEFTGPLLAKTIVERLTCRQLVAEMGLFVEREVDQRRFSPGCLLNPRNVVWFNAGTTSTQSCGTQNRACLCICPLSPGVPEAVLAEPSQQPSSPVTIAPTMVPTVLPQAVPTTVRTAPPRATPTRHPFTLSPLWPGKTHPPAVSPATKSPLPPGATHPPTRPPAPVDPTAAPTATSTMASAT
eukprot:gene3625-biopygen22883